MLFIIKWFDVCYVRTREVAVTFDTFKGLVLVFEAARIQYKVYTTDRGCISNKDYKKVIGHNLDCWLDSEIELITI